MGRGYLTSGLLTTAYVHPSACVTAGHRNWRETGIVMLALDFCSESCSHIEGQHAWHGSITRVNTS